MCVDVRWLFVGKHLLDRAYGAEHARCLVGDVDGLVVLSRSHLAQGLDVFHGEHVGGWIGVGCLDRLGHTGYGFGFGLGGEHLGASLAFGTQDFGLLHGCGLVDLRLLVALRQEYGRGLLSFGV